MNNFSTEAQSNASNLIDAAAAIRKVAVLFKSFTEGADALERIGSLQNAEAESQARLDALRAQETALTERLAAKQADVNTQIAVALGDLEDAERDAIEARSKDLAVGQEILDNANRRAAAIVATADAKAAKTVAAADAKADAYAQEAQRNAERANEVEALRSAAAVELAEIEARLASARAAAKRVLEE